MSAPPEADYKHLAQHWGYWAFAQETLVLNTLETGQSLVISEDQWPEKFHHWVRVCRAKPGQHITLVSEAMKAVFEITHIQKVSLTLVLRERFPLPKATQPVTLAASFIKSDRFEWLLEKTVELGVERLIPLITERTQAKNQPHNWAKSKTRWEKQILAAAEQSEQSQCATLSDPLKLNAFLDTLPENATVIVAVERDDLPLFSASMIKESKAIVLLIGPEGGWSPAEKALFDARGFCQVSLGASMLRTETAAIHLLSLIQHATASTNTNT